VDSGGVWNFAANSCRPYPDSRATCTLCIVFRFRTSESLVDVRHAENIVFLTILWDSLGPSPALALSYIAAQGIEFEKR